MLFLMVLLISCPIWANKINMVYGVNKIDVDAIQIAVTRTRVPAETAHGYDVFELTVNNRPIILPDFYTIEGADCFVQDFDFYTNPFRIVRKTRDFGDTWADTKPATITEYGLNTKGDLMVLKTSTHAPVCDVREIK